MNSEDREKLELARAAEAKKLEGNSAYKAKDFPTAISLYSEAISMCPTEFTYYTNLAAVYFEMKDFEKVIETCDIVIQKAKEGPYDF